MTSYLKKYPPAFQVVVFVGLYIGCTAIYYFFLMGWAMPHLTGVTMTDLQTGDLGNPFLLEVMKWMQLLYTVISFLVPAYLFFYLSDPAPFGYADMRHLTRWWTVLLSILILLACLPLVGVLSDWNQQIHFGSLDQALRELNQKAEDVTQAMLKMPNWKTLIYNLLLIAAIPAIAEEMFFRGVVQRLLVRACRRGWIAILIAAVVFSLLHGEMLGFFPRIALGIILGLIYYITGNLWYSIAAHFVNNGAQVLLLFLFQHHYTTYDITKSEPTPWAAGLGSALIVAGLCYLLWRFARGEGVQGLGAKQTFVREPVENP